MFVTPFASRDRNDWGFTLLEVVAALTVLGLILVALSLGLRFGQQARRIQTADVAVANNVGPVDATLRSLIERAWPGATGTEAHFVGSARIVSFRTQMPEALVSGRARDADVTIGVDRAQQLYVDWLAWYRNWIVAKPRPARIALLSGVDHIELSYWDPTLNLPPGEWVTAWEGTSVPKLLRIRIVFLAGSHARWPDIVVATARDAWEY
jgi:general secretion pathway protein J